MSTHANRVKMTVTSVASSGTGDITLNAASTGFRSFATAYGANATVDILITEGTTWEIARNCTYTHSGTTVSRGTLENSSTGSAVAFTSAAVVSVIAAAEFGNNAEMAIQAVTPGGRLTTESGVPVSTSDRTAQSTLYYTPYVHNIINLWDGSQWKPITFAEHTVTGGTLSGLTSGKPYDVFAYLSSGALATELLVWTNDTTRATAVTLQDGRYCKSGDKTRLLLGTIYTTGTTTTEDSARNRLVCNVYNVARRAVAWDSGNSSKSYTTAAYQSWNNSATDSLCRIFSAIPSNVSTSLTHEGFVSAGLYCRVGVWNGTTVYDAWVYENYVGTYGKGTNVNLVIGLNTFLFTLFGAASGAFNYCKYTVQAAT